MVFRSTSSVCGVCSGEGWSTESVDGARGEKQGSRWCSGLLQACVVVVEEMRSSESAQMVVEVRQVR